MLAPPPEGTFDVENGVLPVKNSSTDTAPEQAPLLTQGDEPEQSNASKGGKVRINLYLYLYFDLASLLNLKHTITLSSYNLVSITTITLHQLIVLTYHYEVVM